MDPLSGKEKAIRPPGRSILGHRLPGQDGACDPCIKQLPFGQEQWLGEAAPVSSQRSPQGMGALAAEKLLGGTGRASP